MNNQIYQKRSDMICLPSMNYYFGNKIPITFKFWCFTIFLYITLLQKEINKFKIGHDHFRILETIDFYFLWQYVYVTTWRFWRIMWTSLYRQNLVSISVAHWMLLRPTNQRSRLPEYCRVLTIFMKSSKILKSTFSPKIDFFLVISKSNTC